MCSQLGREPVSQSPRRETGGEKLAKTGFRARLLLADFSLTSEFELAEDRQGIFEAVIRFRFNL